MAIERWRDEEHVEERRLAGLLSIDLEGKDKIGAIGALRTDSSTAFASRGRSGRLRAASWLVGHNVIEHDLELLANLLRSHTHDPRVVASLGTARSRTIPCDLAAGLSSRPARREP